MRHISLFGILSGPMQSCAIDWLPHSADLITTIGHKPSLSSEPGRLLPCSRCAPCCFGPTTATPESAMPPYIIDVGPPPQQRASYWDIEVPMHSW